jgi:hypothetical protein
MLSDSYGRIAQVRRLFKLAGSVAALAVLAFGCVLLNKVLHDTYRFPYATGTRDKAFLNSTWEMSPNEIERANKTLLEYAPPDFFDFIGPSVTDKTRYKKMVQKNVVTPDESLRKEMKETLEGEFGAGKLDTEDKDSEVRLIWDTGKQTIRFWVIKGEHMLGQDEKGYYFGVSASYKRLESQIDKTIKDEKKKYF